MLNWIKSLTSVVTVRSVLNLWISIGKIVIYYKQKVFDLKTLDSFKIDLGYSSWRA